MGLQNMVVDLRRVASVSDQGAQSPEYLWKAPCGTAWREE